MTIAAKAQQNGLLVRALAGDIIGICPPLIINEEQINDLFDRLYAACDVAEGEIG